MSFSDNTDKNIEKTLNRADAGTVLAREAGVRWRL